MRIVDKYNMRIVGPNCMGVANTAPGVRLSATILSETPPVGSVAFLTQSGALGASLIDFAGELDVGFSVVVSMGNMTNVNPCDLLPMLEADENTKIVCMYMETIPEPYRFERVMSRMTKPVIVVKSGRTTKGAAAGKLAHRLSCRQRQRGRRAAQKMRRHPGGKSGRCVPTCLQHDEDAPPARQPRRHHLQRRRPWHADHGRSGQIRL